LYSVLISVKAVEALVLIQKNDNNFSFVVGYEGKKEPTLAHPGLKIISA
jgi:hypothetical protein